MQRTDSPSRSLYFVNGWIDAAMIGGLSICVFLLLPMFTDGGRTPAVLQAVGIASLFVNFPHYSATIYRLYQSPDNVRQFPVTAFVVPVVVASAVAASFWQPEWIAPYLVTLFIVWSPFHYSGQTIGITMLYARRGGIEIGRWQRLALSAFIYCTFIVSFTHPISDEPLRRYGVTIPVIHFPGWFDAVVIVVMVAGAAGLLAFYVASGLRGRWPPPMVLLPALTQFVWFLPGREPAMFYEFVPFFHCLQYLYIAWAMQIGLRTAEVAPKPRTVLNELLRWAWRNYVGGILLFIVLPLVGYIANAPLVVAAGIVLAGVNIHHFFVDGVIWKLRNTTATSPLMMDVADWTAPRAPAPA